MNIKILWFFFIVFILMIGTTSCSNDNPTYAPPVRQEVVVTKLGVIEFIVKHPEMGEKIKVENMPDWAYGSRQKITTTKGKYLFYTDSKGVVSVKQYNADGFPEFEIYRKD